MMKIVVFGAAGRTGKKVVQEALEEGHEVTAFVHSQAEGINHPKLKVVQGDALNKNDVAAAIAGQDVVISTLGVKDIDSDAVNLMSDAMKIFVEAMKQHGLKRVLAVGGMAVLQENEQQQYIDNPNYPAAYKNVGIGHNKVYLVLKDSGLNWTFACCPDIVDAPYSGEYTVLKDYKPAGLFNIHTGDLAHFLVREAVESKFPSTRVGICNI